MKIHNEPSRSIPVVNEVEVLVCGGGPAGFAAALGAAENGAEVMLIESTNCIGGQATNGLMSDWNAGSKGPVHEKIWANCAEELWENERIGITATINHAKTQNIMLEMLLAAGVKVQLYTFVCDTIMEEDQVKGVITESKSGREAIKAKVVIDCTGDGDVAFHAGVKYVKGREDDQRMQPVTLIFKIGGVDFDKAVFPCSFESNLNIPAGKIQDLGKEHIPFPAGHVLLYRSTIKGYAVLNMTNLIDIDGTDVRDLTKAEIECRRQIPYIMRFLKKYVPGYEKTYVIDIASQMGVRETRHFVGEYTMQSEDIIEGKVFDDWIATKNMFNFDIHNLDGPGLDKNGAQKKFSSRGCYTIPYSACVPQEIDGLLLSGRNISGTHKAHSNYRVMSICSNIGYGVGTAAAISVENDVQVRNVDIKEVQEHLKNHGVNV